MGDPKAKWGTHVYREVGEYEPPIFFLLEKLAATAQQVTHPAEQLMTLLDKIQIHKVYTQAGTALMQTLCLAVTQRR